LLKELRESGSSVPVLILTARDAVSDKIRGLDAGADDYLVKPFSIAELLARLRALIRRAAGKAQPIISFGEITVDLTARVVFKAGQSVPLTAREYSIVELLALHRGELVTRTMMYEHLFDEDNDSFSNIVDVHVSNIRKKLGKEFVRTHRGHGYIADPPPRSPSEAMEDV
jgi:two-component system OmpR family response regulator